MPKPVRLEDVLIGLDWMIQDVVSHLNNNACGIVLVVDAERKLLHTVTDGDLRRAILQKIDFTVSIEKLIDAKEKGPASEPITAELSTGKTTLLELMRRHKIRHIPLLDEKRRVVGLSLLEELIEEMPPAQAVIMAGGYGKRLHPLTQNTPKSLLPIGDRSLMQRVVQQLREAGINHINISTYFLSDQIKKEFSDGHQLGVHITYVTEDRPLGTAGSLSLLDKPKEPLLVINGDILTRMDFRAMLHFHQDYAATMTVAIKQYAAQVPYGVVNVEGIAITRLTEKPTTSFLVVAGIYLLNPEAWDYLPRGEFCDMPDLINRLLSDQRKVVSFPISEYWLDIGRHEDYKHAQDDAAKGEFQDTNRGENNEPME